MKSAILVALIIAATIPAITHTEPARAASGACSITEAKRDVARAERRLAEARRVLAETRRYTDAYGASVGRWTRLARRVRWPWPQFPTLMRVMDAESNGSYTAANPYSGCAGLMQLAACWWSGIGNPYDPKFNLRRSLYVQRHCGWGAWSTY